MTAPKCPATKCRAGTWSQAIWFCNFSRKCPLSQATFSREAWFCFLEKEHSIRSPSPSCTWTERTKMLEMIWKDSTTLSMRAWTLSSSSSAFIPSFKWRQAGTEMQRQQRTALLIIHSDSEARASPHYLFHKWMQYTFRWQMFMTPRSLINTDDIQDTHQFQRKILVLVVKTELRASWILHELYHKTIFMDTTQALP